MSIFRPVENRFLIVATRTAHEAMDIAACACGVTMPDIVAKGRSRDIVAHARQIAMYLAHVVGHMSLTEISITFERDRSTVAHACHAIEDRRESVMFDRQIDLLEKEMRRRLQMLFEMRRLRAPPPAAKPRGRRPFDGLDRERRVRLARRPRVTRRPRSR